MSDWLANLHPVEAVWLTVGFAGQAFFFFRLLIQWLASEKRRQSVVPIAYWYLSLAGGALLFGYAVYRKDPVFILGQALGVFVYIRNLVLIRRAREHLRTAAETS